jgi:hypothetical protein
LAIRPKFEFESFSPEYVTVAGAYPRHFFLAELGRTRENDLLLVELDSVWRYDVFPPLLYWFYRLEQWGSYFLIRDFAEAVSPGPFDHRSDF